MSGIRTLHIRNESRRETSHSLDELAQIDNNIVFALPTLQELKLEYAAFNGNNADILIVYLNKRRECGLGIQKIVFLRSLVDDEVREVTMPRFKELCLQ